MNSFSGMAFAADWVGPELKLPPFVDSLPIPTVIDLTRQKPGEAYPVTASQFLHRFHRNLPPSPVWSYNQTFPGPTIEVEANREARILWSNQLPNRPLIDVEGGMIEDPKIRNGRTVVHLHGASVPEVGYFDKQVNADGYPDAWNPPGASQLAIYPNVQEPAGLWYHDHTIGITSQNVYSGLSGLYFIRSPDEKKLKLPTGKYEIPLFIQSRSFREDGSLFYPAQVTGEFYGNTTTVNGKVWPYLDVEPKRYRFRVVNGSNSRTYTLGIQPRSGKAIPFYQIGSDGGFLSERITLTQLILAPGERADLIVDFAEFAGQEVLLANRSESDDDAEVDGAKLEPAIPNVMLFKVAQRPRKLLNGPYDPSVIPRHFKAIRPLLEVAREQAGPYPKVPGIPVRNIFLQEFELADGNAMLLMNNLKWTDPVVEKPIQNSIEIWNLVNVTEDVHPFHVHLVQFQVLSRQALDVEATKKANQIVTQGPVETPDLNEQGWKDTVRASPGKVTQIIMRFGPYYGRYVYHCHILEHEDMDMMRPFDVLPAQEGWDASRMGNWRQPFKFILNTFRDFLS